MSISERNTLPGGPTNRLVREVRRCLWVNFQCRPNRLSSTWIETWSWAAEVCGRADAFNRAYGIKKGRTKPWPSPREIASQYMLICLAQMHKHHQFQIHRKAADCLDVHADHSEYQFMHFVTSVFQ